MKDWPAEFPPRAEKLDDIRLGERVIAGPIDGPLRIVNRSLDIDDE